MRVPFLVFAFLMGAGLAQGQHDPERDATRHVAEGRFDRAAATLEKSPAGQPETAFVRMMAALRQGNLSAAVDEADAARALGLPLDRLVGLPAPELEALHTTESYSKWIQEEPYPWLLHGPMVGGVSDEGAILWLRGATADLPVTLTLSGPEGVRRFEARTAASMENAAKLSLTGLRPNTRYNYHLRVAPDGEATGRTDASGSFTTYATHGKASQFSVAFGGGAGYIPEWERMWDTIRSFEPDALFMLGDNVYIDHPESDLTQRYCYYRRQSRPEWRRLTAVTPVFAIYDDHDFGLNDCIPGPDIDSPAWKRPVWKRFRDNWANPAFGGGDEQPGCYFDHHIGDVHFIFLDGRFYRDLDGGTMLGPVQRQWLMDRLGSSKGIFKVLVSPVPWSPGIKPGSRDPWDGFPEEREAIFSFIESQKIEGVFLVAADRHRTDLRKIGRPQGYDLFEFESSKLTNRHTHGVVQTEGFIWGHNQTCSFGHMRFDTTLEDPQVQFDAVTIDGEIVHTYTLKRSALTFATGSN